MNSINAAYKVLQEAGKPLHYAEIARRIVQSKLWLTSGRTPENTVNRDINQEILHCGKLARFVNASSAIQDALLAHPFYLAVAHLAICAWRSAAAMIPTLELNIPPGAEAYDARLLLGGRDAGRLRDVRSRLVETQGVRSRGLNNGNVTALLMANVVRNLLALQILRQQDDQLEFHPQFQASLMASRLRTVFRPGKDLQQQMLQVLRKMQGADRSVAEVDS